MEIFQQRFATRKDIDYAALVERKKSLHRTMMDLHQKLVQRLSPDVILEGAEKLGLLRNDVLVCHGEAEMFVMQDYCLHNVVRNGRNCVEQFLHDCPPAEGSDEIFCLQVLKNAKYTMILMTDVESGVGGWIIDLFTGESRLLIDINLSRTAERGLLIATRLLDYGPYVTMTGAGIPISILSESSMRECVSNFRRAADVDYFDPTELIGTALARGALSRIHFADEKGRRKSTSAFRSVSPSSFVGRKQTPADSRVREPSRNQRCRCGSGKMYKNCCWKKKATKE
jgi:hypothetical protein